MKNTPALACKGYHIWSKMRTLAWSRHSLHGGQWQEIVWKSQFLKDGEVWSLFCPWLYLGWTKGPVLWANVARALGLLVATIALCIVDTHSVVIGLLFQYLVTAGLLSNTFVYFSWVPCGLFHGWKHILLSSSFSNFRTHPGRNSFISPLPENSTSYLSFAVLWRTTNCLCHT